MKIRKEKKIIIKPEKIRRSFLSRFKLLNQFKHWWVGGMSVTRSLFRVTAAWQGIAVLLGVVSVGYTMAAFYTGAGEFVIRVDNPANTSLQLCDTPEFEKPLVLLKGTAIPQADNISIFDIDPNVTEINGSHNGDSYVAYTFYLKNVSLLETNYRYALSIRSSSKNVDDASWVMLYHNGKENIYAKLGSDGKPERQYSEYPFPFVEDALFPEKQIQQLSAQNPGGITEEIIKAHGFESLDNVSRLQTTPFASSKMICTAERVDLQPGEVDKFTVVAWLEGEDKECVDAILGGHIELLMKFTY